MWRWILLAAAAGIGFRNEPSRTPDKYLIESMTGGVALFDAEGDGDLDIYLVNGATLKPGMPNGAKPDKSDPKFWNRLYRNDGAGKFTDITAEAGVQGSGYGMGVATGDYNGDGRTDLYVTSFGGNILYRNEGKGRFTNVTAAARVAAGGWSTGAAFVDYDNDGDLDLFVARYLKWDFGMNKWCGAKKEGYRSYCHPDEFEPVAHILYRNEGNGTFTDVSAATGIAGHKGKGLGVVVLDFNSDGRPDIAVANDSYPQQLFRNEANGRFTEVALEAGIAYDEDGRTFAGMGIDSADYDNDGRPDLFINALADQRYWLFRNMGGGAFQPATGTSGIGEITRRNSGWGAKLIDYDNDGWRDLFVAQGHVMDNIELTQPGLRYKEPLLLLRNLAGKFSRFPVPGFETPQAGRGAAFGDLNNDGTIDIVVNCNNAPPVVHFNQVSPRGNWILVDVPVGSKVMVTTSSGRQQQAYATSSGSYLSASDSRLHFGLGADKSPRINIIQTNGKSSYLSGVKINTVTSMLH